MILQELFSSAQPFRWTLTEEDRYIAMFSIDEQDYVMTFCQCLEEDFEEFLDDNWLLPGHKDLDDVWDVMFGLVKKWR